MNKDNMKVWNAHADIPPKMTTDIVGKDYKGTSPNPQYVIQCLTNLFGPVGLGFGWRIVAEGFNEFQNGEVLHWCRIEFWHTSRENTYEAYGQTKAAFMTKGGIFRVDEDAPKKSLTDAIVKAASQLGIAANIFLGRWDDSKYVAKVNAEFEAAEAADVNGWAAKLETVKIIFKEAKTKEGLRELWNGAGGDNRATDILKVMPDEYFEKAKAALKAIADTLPAQSVPDQIDLGDNT